MPTPAERQALLFLAAILALGTGVRVLRGRGSGALPTAQQALAGQIAAVDSAIAARGRGRQVARAAEATRARAPRRVAAPIAPPTPPPRERGAARLVDLDTAPESVLVTLPGIGPALARRIIEDRARHGPFGAVSALTRVVGIGEKTAARLAPHVTFSAALRRPQ